MRGSGGRRQLAALVVAACLVGSGWAAAPVARAMVEDAATVGSDAQWADTETDARVLASEYGHPVAVSSETTPTTEVQALPDGQFQMTADSVPQRALVDDAWEPVDTTLARHDDGFFAPAVAAEPVEFSPGGSDVMAKVRADDGSWADEVWPYGNLPAPTVSGASATYPSVLPGVDLVLTANPSGMSELLVVQDALAAADPELAAVELGVREATLRTDTVHTMLATTTAGGKLTAGEPLWWDSSDPDASVHGPAGAQEPKPLNHEVAANAETLDIADALASDVTFPVYVDPDWSTGDNDHWYDDRDYPDQSYLNGNYNADWLGTGAAEGIYMSRAFWQFPTSALAGKSVTASKLSLYEQYQGASNAVELYLLQTHVTPGATWNQENATSGAWDHPQVGFTPAVGTQGVDVTHSMQWVASSSQSVVQFGLRSTNEADQSTRKHWNLNATLTVTYDSAPNKPTALSIASPARGCGSSSSPAYLNSAVQNLDLAATTSDPDSGDTVAVTFAVTAADGTTVWTHTTSSTAQGVVETTIPKGSFGEGAYRWTATPTDSKGVDGPVSGTCYFTADNTAPPLPTVTPDPGSDPAVVGHAMTVDVTSAAADHVAAYEYWWQDGATTGTGSTATVPFKATVNGSAPCPSYQGKYSLICVTSTSTTLTVAPTDGQNPGVTLWVAAIDEAGNTSSASTPTAKGWLNVRAKDDPCVTSAAASASNPCGNGIGGHVWLTTDAASIGASSVPDSVGEASSALQVTGDIAVSDTSSTGGNTQDDPTMISGLTFSGYATLARALDSDGDRAPFIEGGVPSGATNVSTIGQIVAPDAFDPANAPQHPTLKPLYKCAVSGDVQLVLGTSSCDSGSSPSLQGYAWANSDSDPSSSPAGDPSDPAGGRVPIMDCIKDGDHFESSSPTCEGYTVVEQLASALPMSKAATDTSSLIDTTKSFTAAAWVYPSNDVSTTQNHTILAESGASNSGFYLQESRGEKGPVFRFCLRTQSGALQTPCVDSSALVVQNHWTFVVGVWDAVNHRITIHVGSTFDTDDTAAWSVPSDDTTATGPVTVGSAVTNKLEVHQWNGDIADPAVFQGVIDFDQFNELYLNVPVTAN